MKNSKKLWSGKSRGGAFGHLFFLFLISKIGITAAYVFLSLIVIYFIPFAPKATKAIWRYNRGILKYSRLRSLIKLYCHYYCFGQTLIDKVAIANGLEGRYKFEFENYNQFLEQLKNGATVIIGAHIGCWEIGASFFGDYAKRLNIVMYDAEYQKIKDIVNNNSAGYKVIAINDGDIDSIIKMKRAIDMGEYLCLQGDRYVNESSALVVNFMGKEALFPTGPSLLASKFSTPVVFYFAMRERGKKYRFKFNVLPAGASKEKILEIYSTNLESVVREYPQQWFNFYDVWQRK